MHLIYIDLSICENNDQIENWGTFIRSQIFPILRKKGYTKYKRITNSYIEISFNGTGLHRCQDLLEENGLLMYRVNAYSPLRLECPTVVRYPKYAHEREDSD